MDPLTPELPIMRPAHQCRILARHAGLVAIAIESPGLDLSRVELAAVQKLMEGMLVVIALDADGADSRFERLRAHGLTRRCNTACDLVHVCPPWGNAGGKLPCGARAPG